MTYYGGVSITSSTGRLYGRILKATIEMEIADIEKQSRFSAGRSCWYSIFTTDKR